MFFAALALFLLLPAAAFAIVPVPNGADPGPCTITLYWDEAWTGCDEVQPESERGSLMAAAGENAIAVMRAWRRRNPELVVPTVQDTSTAGGAAAEALRNEFAALLRREMGRTFAVDSMAVSIASDSIGASEAVLQSRYWLARSVRQGKGPIARQVGWVDYWVVWRKIGERWAIGTIREVDELTWELGADISGPDQFPSRPGKSMAPLSIEERLTRSRQEIQETQAAERGEQTSVIAVEPVPVVTVQPAYPEFAREAQIQGRVILDVLVTPDGRVANVQVLKGVTGLNEAAMHAVKRWTFSPALDGAGNPIAAWIRVPVDFHF